MSLSESTRIIGDEIFYNFIEIEMKDLPNSSDLTKQLRNNKLDGFILKNLFTKAEIGTLLLEASQMPQEAQLSYNAGTMFPAPFAMIQDSGDSLNLYFQYLKSFYDFIENRSLDEMLKRINNVFVSVSEGFKVKVPSNKIKKAPLGPGTLRVYKPNMGGLHVHCGNFFQEESKVYYDLIEDNIDMDDQLSYFLLLQNSEAGGELTLYDLLWKDVKKKDDPSGNEYLIKDDGTKLYLTELRSFALRLQPGDLLVFQGGPIWHRVEDIKGKTPRITYGGFLNYSKDNTELYYWS